MLKSPLDERYPSKVVQYWIDSNVLIDAKNHYYAFTRVPAFWRFLDARVADGTIAIPELVFDEITQIDDELSDWAKPRRNSGLVVSPTPAVQLAYTGISDHVMQMYNPTPGQTNPHVDEFLRGADAWLIAHAKVMGGCVVTREAKKGIGAKKPTIPNVGEDFGVVVKDVWMMLNELNPSF